MTLLTVPVVVLDEGLPLPAYARPDDAGMDLSARTGATVGPGRRELIPTGIALALPPGYVGLVHPRSGLAARHGVTVLNAPGTVDAGYRGEIMVCLLNTDPSETFEVRRGDRIAQLVVQPVTQVTWERVTALANSPRGDAGHGSTGVQGPSVRMAGGEQ